MIYFRSCQETEFVDELSFFYTFLRNEATQIQVEIVKFRAVQSLPFFPFGVLLVLNFRVLSEFIIPSRMCSSLCSTLVT